MEDKELKSYKIPKKVKKKAVKPKDDTAARIESFNAEIYKSIRKYVNNNSEFLIIDEYEGGMLLAKTIRVTVKKVTGIGVFHQHETFNETKYCVNTIVEYIEYPDRTAFITELFRTGCPVLEIGSPMQVKEVLDGI